MSSFHESRSKKRSRSRTKSIAPTWKPQLLFKTGHYPLEEWQAMKLHSVSQESLHDTTLLDFPTYYEVEFELKHPDVPALHRVLNLAAIKEIENIFKTHPVGKLTQEELRIVIENHKTYYTNAEFDRLFLKINTDRDSLCSWSEFLDYLIMGFEDDDGETAKDSLDPPIKEATVTTKQTRHRYQIKGIDFCPMVAADRKSSARQGGYTVIADNGQTNSYTLNWEYQRSGMSNSPSLKIAKTYVQCFACMPDIRIVCVASTERDLRFYDTSANTHSLRFHMTKMPEYATAMNYYWSEDSATYSKLIVGDTTGTVRVFEFDSEGRGPFRSSSGATVTTVEFHENLNEFTITEYLNLHKYAVCQVGYSPGFNAVISACQFQDTKYTPAGLFLLDMGETKAKTKFRMTKGVSTFFLDEDSKILATGGFDWILRLWSPHSPDEPFCTLAGHHAKIDFLFIQDGAKVYTVDTVKVVKIWDIEGQCLLQTFIHLPRYLPEDGPFGYFYNDFTREFVVAGGKFVILKCCPRLSLDLTDGDTHTRPVSVVLYNELFEVVVTCGYDSFIIVWNIWTGARLELIKMAHSRVMLGEVLRVEITAACFDPKQQLLLTGARDGTLRIWNFNNGFCVRNLIMTENAEVTAVFWIPDRILAVGWNKFVIEFADAGVETEFPKGKRWYVQHDEEILCAAVCGDDAVATASYDGQLVIWRQATGQAYCKYQVKQPTKPIRLVFGGNKKEEECYSPEVSRLLHRLSSMRDSKGSSTAGRALSIIKLPSETAQLRELSVQSVIFLETRPIELGYGTLLTALSNGKIQLWNHHVTVGGYMDQFIAIHMAGDCVSYMCTDKTETYLFTGTNLGYIKIWLITNFGTPDKKHISMPRLRLKFPFLIATTIMGRAKRSVRRQPNPMLLSSMKGHTKSITCITYIERNELLLTGSTDHSVRLWSLGCRYIGTFGSPVVWHEIEPTIVSDIRYRIPPDIKREASFTTLHVLTDGAKHPVFRKKAVDEEDEEELVRERQMKRKDCIYGRSLNEPILGRHSRFSKVPKFSTKPVLDKSLPYTPIYTHVNVPGVQKRTNCKDED